MRLHKIDRFTLDEVEKPKPQGNEILIRVEACGICGSDIPRVYELGTRVYPVTLGHEFSGVVCEVGNNDDKMLIGKKAAVFPIIPCMKCKSCQTGNYAECENYQYLGSRNDGGFAEYCLIPNKWHLVLSNDPEVSTDDLSLVEPATVAQHAIRKAGLTAGEKIVIIGAGPIGIMAARWAKIFGASEVALLEIDNAKISFAKECGLAVYNINDVDYIEKIINKLERVDVVIEGTGTSSGMNTAIELCRVFGKIVLMGNPHRDTVINLNNHSLILRKELNLIGIWNSYYAELPFNEWKYTVRQMDLGKLKVHDLITHRVSLDNLKQLFDKIYGKKIMICKAIYSASLNV
ncbi:galactitol-1-phosphate 5-dehydrogenase [Pectinatus sottacetonis]|uniref:galactitol-1-phosphate 5-dehydrogenase n=1 Tax=Pectinatus sottacetonis TaxID=1002795 RepID=UPI001E52C90A|nr:galactitol-1-phosphate 5-dehydrogenase [Pectinatus sottacetonis]